MRRTTSKRLISLASVAVLLLAVAGCGTDSDDGDERGDDTPGAEGFAAPDLPMLEELGEMEGAGQHPGLAGLRRGRHRPTRPWTG